MSSVTITLAHVLDGIAMSIKTSTSLKKTVSYRAVEILLVDLHGFQKTNQDQSKIAIQLQSNDGCVHVCIISIFLSYFFFMVSQRRIRLLLFQLNCGGHKSRDLSESRMSHKVEVRHNKP